MNIRRGSAGRKGPTIVDADESPRKDTTAETLAKLRPAFPGKEKADDLTVTADDPSGSVMTNYTDTVSFSTSDGQGTIIDPTTGKAVSLAGFTYTFSAADHGTHTFSVDLKTAGYQAISCDGGCNGHFIAGASAEGRLTSTTLGTGGDAARLTIGLNGEFGFGKPEGTTLVSLTGGLPIALIAGGPAVKIAPFLRPAIGWGRETNDIGSMTGTRC